MSPVKHRNFKVSKYHGQYYVHSLHATPTDRHIKSQLHRLHLERLGWHRQWKNWRYKNTTLLIVSLSVFFLLASTPWLSQAIDWMGGTGYIGAFVVGILFVSLFTAAPASIVLFQLADHLHPIGIAVVAGAGGVVGDFIIFSRIKGGLFDELTPLFQRLTTHRVRKLFYTPYFQWLMPIAGIIFIASPGPDEVGIGLLGLTKIKPWQFLLVTFALDFLGILFIVTLAKST